MATASQAKITVTSDYVNIVSTIPALASVNVLVQNLDDDFVDVVCGASSAANAATLGPIRLNTGEAYTVNAASIWVRGKGTMSATVA
jgi:hypothetical protein